MHEHPTHENNKKQQSCMQLDNGYSGGTPPKQKDTHATCPTSTVAMMATQPWCDVVFCCFQHEPRHSKGKGVRQGALNAL